MSRKDCVSNRNTKIVLTYLRSILGDLGNLLEGIDYPLDRYPDAESYYLNEDEWDTLENYRTIYHKAKELVGDPNFFFNCGASSASYQSWGSFKYFKRIMAGPKALYERVPTFNRNFNDTKEFDIIVKPHEENGRIKTTYRIKFHEDIDPHSDYCSDPHIRGIVASAPEVWGLDRAAVTQPLVEYDPLILLNREFDRFNLDARIMSGKLLITDPQSREPKVIGREVFLVPETRPNKYGDPSEEVFLGKYSETGEGPKAVMLTKDIVLDGEEVAKKGTLFKAPYFIINVECDVLTLRQKAPYLFRFGMTKKEVFDGLMHSFTQTRIAVKVRNEALEQIQKYATDLEGMVEQRTKDLRETQTRLIEAEKRTLEHRITGGFAHEMRNALAGAQLEFKTTLNYKDQGTSSAQILKDSVTGLLKNISLIHEKYKVPREEIATLVLPELKIIAEIADHLSHVHSGVSSDLNRALSITTQIREYSRMSEFRPGDAEVDMVAMLKGYGERYKQDFERIGIKYSVSGLEKAIVKADDIHMNSIFSNLILNAKDALEESAYDRQKEIGITVDKDMAHEGFVVNVSDNGPGISEENLNEIFEPFYSTKPTTGTGLGLGVVKRLIRLYDGRIDVKSKPGTGTKFSVMLPYNV